MTAPCAGRLRISRGAPEWLEATAPVRTIASAINDSGNSGARCRRNAGAICLQPSLFRRRLQYLGDKRSADPRRLRASASDARADAAQARARSGSRRPKRRTRSGRPRRRWSTDRNRAKRRDQRAALSRRRRRRRPAAARGCATPTEERSPRRAARRRTSMSISPPRSRRMRAVVDETLAKAGLAERRSGAIAIGLGLAGFKRRKRRRRGSPRLFPAFGSCARRTTRPPPASAPTPARTAGW